MQKQAILGLAGKAIGFTASKVVPKVLNAGYKGLVRPVARMALKRPGLALTGAIMPSWISGNMNTASQIGLSSLPRSLPKFASIQGDEMSDRKYPAVFYKVEGFEKMAAEAETAHRLVKKAFFGSLGKIFGGSSSSAEAAKTILDRVLKTTPRLEGEAAIEFGKRLVGITNELGKKPSLWKELLQSVRNMPAALKIALPVAVSYPFVHKAYKQYQENKETESSYRNMLRIYPELQRESPQNTRQYFDYIKKYSPTVAKNPHAAGVIMKRFAGSGGMLMDNTMIKNLLEVEKVKSDAGPHNKGMLAALGDLI